MQDLRRGLLRARGFALFIGVCNSPAERDAVIEVLDESMVGVKVEVARVGSGCVDVLEDVVKQVDPSGSGPLMVVDLEKAVGADDQDHAIFQSLNLKRPEWPGRLNRPVVLWVPEYLIGLLGRKSPDFLDWRSDTLHFPMVEEREMRALGSEAWREGKGAGLGVEHRRERVAELSARLMLPYDGADAVVTLARAGWLAEMWGHLRMLGDWDGAERAYQEAAELYRDLLERGEGSQRGGDRSLAVAAFNFGNLLYEKGDLAGAKGCFERAMKIDEAAYGAEHPAVARDVNNIGNVLKALGDLAGAKGCLERALRIDEAAYGAEHPEVARDVNNLGSVLQALGDLEGAKGCFERALRIDEAAYGAEHPDVARDVNNLGSVLQALGDLAGAKGCFERALRIFVKFLGEEHPKTRLVRGNLEGVMGKR